MTIETPVLVVGGGPTGLCLGMDLAWQGTPCIVIERRTERTTHPKATLLGARSMEQLRRWDLEDEIYQNSLPNDVDYKIFFVTGMNGEVLMKFESPSIDKVRSRDPKYGERWPELRASPYGKTQIGQQAVEPILVEHAKKTPNLQFMEGWKLVSFDQDSEGVTAHIEHVVTGEEKQIRCQYMVGADGGGSVVRRGLGIPFVGRGAMRPNVSFLFRSTEFAKSHNVGPGNLYYVMLPDTFGVFMSINGKDLWGYQYYFLDPEKKTDQPDVKAILHRAVGKAFDFELLNITHWQHHQSVATHFRAGRVFLAGDAAHLFSPTGGVGMNTGINDAFDLSWKLNAVLSGWGGEWLLDSYEQERRPIAIRNTQRAAANSDKNDMIMAEVNFDLLEASPRGQLLRAKLSQKLAWVAGQYDSAGVHLGYRYQKSDICWSDPAIEPPDDYRVVSQTSYPGCRAPHVWLADGRSTLDLYGRDYVLLRLGSGDTDGDELISAFADRGVPLRVEQLDEPEVLQAYENYRLVLVRPDGHVAWRGNNVPSNALEVVDRVRGALRPRFVPEWASPDDIANLPIPV